MRASTQLQSEMTTPSELPFSAAQLNNTSRNNWKPLFEVNFSKNSTKTIRFFTSLVQVMFYVCVLSTYVYFLFLLLCSLLTNPTI